jgi:hypothetical protein
MSSPAHLQADRPTPLAGAAISYARRGWPVLPCAPRSKVPLARNGFHAATAEIDTVAAWWRAEPTANIAVVPAGVVRPDGSSLLVLDCDGEAGFAAALAVGVPRDTACVVTGRLGGGEHRYFTVPPGVRIGNRTLDKGLDVRHAAGYVLVPPSVHPSGASYRWRSEAAWMPGAVRGLPPSVLDRLRAEKPHTVRSCRPTCRTHGSSGLGARQSDKLFRSESAKWWRLSRYLLKVPARLSDGRKTVGYRLAAALVHDFGLEAGEVWDVLAAWNADNTPPLPDGALDQLLRNAAKYGLGSRRSLVRGAV